MERTRASRARGGVAIGALLLGLGAVACGSNGADAGPQTAAVTLIHAPSGTADVGYDPATRQMTVTVRLQGLTPNSRHLWDFGTGDCSGPGQGSVAPDPDRVLIADEHGVGQATTSLTHLDRPLAGAFVHVHIGPTAGGAGQQAAILACANMTGTSGTLTLGPSYGPGSRGAGAATLSRDASGAMAVQVTLDGLAPGNAYPVDIRHGSCADQGSIAYSLPLLRSDGVGHAAVGTTLTGVADVTYGAWYVLVHRGPGLEQADQFTPMACGDVTR